MNINSQKFCEENFIWDDHCGFEMTPDARIGPLLQPWREAGIDYFSINVYYDPLDWTRCLENIATLRRRLPLEAPWCRIVSSVTDIDAARVAGKAAVTFDIEGMNALNGRADLVQTYYELGVRHMLFAYNRNNLAGAYVPISAPIPPRCPVSSPEPGAGRGAARHLDLPDPPRRP
jgi:membrane dipeptidase